MHRQPSIALGMVLLLTGVCQIAVAQETPPAPAVEGSDAVGEQSTYLDLRRSKDRTTRQWAERYFTLTKLQEWTSAKGKKVKAKYVSHAPDLASVTLAIGNDNKTVAVAQLDKSSQSRVKQIAATQKKLDELIAAGAKAEPGQPGESAGGDPGAPMVDERGNQPPARRPPGPRRPPSVPPDAPSGSPPGTEAPLADDGGSDPLGFGELPANSAPQVPPATVTLPAGAGPPTSPGDAAGEPARDTKPKDKASWRTDYAVFRANFKVDASQESAGPDWGSLKELKAAAAVVKKWEDDGDVGEEAHREIAKSFEAVGEFTWEATLTDADVSSGDWTERLNLPPLPEPLTIGFILDPDRDPGNWQRFKAGDRVRFVGRFADIEGGIDIVAAIRFPDEAATDSATSGAAKKPARVR